jgi:glucose-1-phosphate thymidylyltransferase
MKGIILSGGEGTRMRPLTRVTSKQLLPLYNKPMIFYPLGTLLKAGIKEILIIVAPDHCGDYMKLLGSGREFGVRFTYEIQDKPEGLAQAFILGENFLDDGDNVTLILGDNIFEDDISSNIKEFTNGAVVHVKEVPPIDQKRLGIAELDENNKVLSIVEKPEEPKSPYAVTGAYIYDGQVVAAAKSLKPSGRGELEITDLNNWYLNKGQLTAKVLSGNWIDAGTFESYQLASDFVYKMSQEGRELGAKDMRSNGK